MLVHEARGLDEAGERGMVSFDDIIKLTPEHLGPGKGFYTMIAIALKAGAWRDVSRVLVARELAAGIVPPTSERALARGCPPRFAGRWAPVANASTARRGG